MIHIIELRAPSGHKATLGLSSHATLVLIQMMNEYFKGIFPVTSYKFVTQTGAEKYKIVASSIIFLYSDI